MPHVLLLPPEPREAETVLKSSQRSVAGQGCLAGVCPLRAQKCGTRECIFGSARERDTGELSARLQKRTSVGTLPASRVIQ